MSIVRRSLAGLTLAGVLASAWADGGAPRIAAGVEAAPVSATLEEISETLLLWDALYFDAGFDVGSTAGASKAFGFPTVPIGGPCSGYLVECPAVYDPVICADGNVYPNECIATYYGCTDGCESVGFPEE